MGRNDAKQVYDIPILNQIYPYMMKRRCDSLVYQTMIVDITEIVAFIKSHKASDGRTYRIFEILTAAILRTIAMRPELNRFIARRKYWQRNELSFNFIVKEDFSDDAPEHSKPLAIDPASTLDQIADIVNQNIIEGKTPQAEGFTDKVIAFFLHFPSWFVSGVVNLAGMLDHFGHAPNALREADGLHTSIFISNLGSIGLEGTSPHHHLYEWGTTSIFMTIGMMKHKRMPNGELHQLVEIGFTVDERIADGWYFAQSFRLFKHLVANPEELVARAALPPTVLTKKEVKAKKKEARLAQKKASSEENASNTKETAVV